MVARLKQSEDERLTEVIDIQAGRSRRGSEEAPER